MLVRDKVSVRIGQESGWYRGNFIRPSIVRGTDFYLSGYHNWYFDTICCAKICILLQEGTQMMKQHIAILCDNKPGVLTHVAGLISRRAINIEYINAGYTEEPDVTRINIVLSVEDKRALNQAILQLARLIDVIKVVNLDEAPFISYELAMIKVKVTSDHLSEIANLAELFHAKIVDVNPESVVMRVTGREDHIEALLQMLKGYEILEMARTGQISLSRGANSVKKM